jgi:hypothetical protein
MKTPSVLLSAPTEYYKFVVTFNILHDKHTVTIWAVSYDEALLWARETEDHMFKLDKIEGSF